MESNLYLTNVSMNGLNNSKRGMNNLQMIQGLVGYQRSKSENSCKVNDLTTIKSLLNNHKIYKEYPAQ